MTFKKDEEMAQSFLLFFPEKIPLKGSAGQILQFILNWNCRNE